MTPHRRTRSLVSALALLSLAGCTATGMPGTSVKPATGDGARGDANSTDGSARSGAGLSNALSRVGHTAASSGNYPTAVRMYRRAHDLAPNQVGPALGLARAASAVKDHRAAADAYRDVLRVEPDNVDALSGLGRELMSLDRPREAIPYLRAALTQRREAWVHNELGVALEMTGEVGSAMEQYQAGLELAPRDLSLRTNLGRSLAWTGDYQAAIEILRAVAADPDATRRNREALALVYALGGDIPAAQEVSRIDLSTKEVDNKLAYFGLLGELARSEDRDAVAKVLAGSALRTVSSSPRAGGAAPMVDRRDLDRDNAERERRARAAAAAAAARAASSAQAARDAAESKQGAEPRKLTRTDVPDRVTRKPTTAARKTKPRARVVRAAATLIEPGDGPYAWQVQLAAFRTPARAELGWKILNRKVPDVLRSYQHFVRDPNPAFKWDRLFRLRTLAFETRGPADELCARLNSRDLECLVVRTQRVPGLRMASGARVAQADHRNAPDGATPAGATADVPADEATKAVSRTPEPPTPGQAADDVVQTAVTDQASPARRVAEAETKARGPRPAYQVQLAAYRTARRAERGWREIRQAAPDLLGNLGHTVEQAGSATSGRTLHRLRTLAYAGRVPAQALCDKLKRRGVECIVVSTPDHAGLVYEPSEFESVETPPPPAPKVGPNAARKSDGNRRYAGGYPEDFTAF